MVLIDTEHYLPNYKGTKGFADILAKDCKDHLTVIEVKKSNSTAREAIHEVFKISRRCKNKQRTAGR